MQNAIALIELSSISQGIVTLDHMLKKATITLLDAAPFSPGKYYILIHGEIADVEESYQIGKHIAARYLIDHLLIPDIHNAVLPAIEGTSWDMTSQAVAVIETFTIASAIQAADIAAKTTDIKLHKLRLGSGIGGKGYFTFSGELNAAEGSLNAAKDFLEPSGYLLNSIIIPNPDQRVYEKLL